MFGLNSSTGTYYDDDDDSSGDERMRRRGIDPGPPPPTGNLAGYAQNRTGGLWATGGFPPYYAFDPTSPASNPHNHYGRTNVVVGAGGRRTGRDLVHWSVVKEDDARRGFRMFDGILMSVKDVSSEELFLERMKIAYSAYDAYVAGLVERSPLEITRGLVQAVSACLVKYFTTQSALRTNRPFIAKVLNLEGVDMFCSHSDFVRSFLFTNASAEDEAVISLAEKVYAENDFDVCGGGGGGESGADYHGQRRSGDNTSSSTSATAADTSLSDQLFDLGMRIAERSIVGGTNASLGSRDRASHFATLSDELPFQQRKDGTGRSLEGGTSAMLIMVTDFEALHNYVAYVLYLTPAQLTRRYDVNFDCLRRPSSDASADCCRVREAKKRKSDDTKVVIRAVIEKKRREKIDTMVGRSAACEATLREHAARTLRRNNDLLRHVLLMLFDKCLTGIIDKGFENLNRRRGYAVNSAKEIGAATIYTGIVDTVGEVSVRLEGHALERVVTGGGGGDREPGKDDGDTRPQLRFSLPLSSIVTGGVANTGDSDRRRDGSDGGGGVSHTTREPTAVGQDAAADTA